MKDRKVIILKEKWNSGAHEAPSPREVELVEVAPREFVENPFPLSPGAQKRLLELIHNRKSGIITRQELIDVLFNPKDTEPGTLIQCAL